MRSITVAVAVGDAGSGGVCARGALRREGREAAARRRDGVCALELDARDGTARVCGRELM